MPQYMVSDGNSSPRFARIDNKGKKVSWVYLEEATGFPAAQEAKAAFLGACEAMLAAAEAAGEKALKAGKLEEAKGAPFPTGGKYRLPLKKGQSAYGAASHDDFRVFFANDWLWKNRARLDRYDVGSRASKEDFLGVFETFYVRKNGSWLSRPQTKGAGGVIQWGPSFALAVPYLSSESAHAALSKHGGRGCVIKTSCAFTEVQPGASSEPDELAEHIKAACEARDIQAAIAQSARERMDAMAAPGELGRGPASGAAEIAPKKKASRL